MKCPHCGVMIESGEAAKDTAGTRTLRSLTRREREVLYALSLGATDRELSRILAITLNTVRTHLLNIYRKTGMGNRLEAVLFLQAHPDLLEGCKKEAKEEN
jgi:LuxR family transcriptional regulator of csgAB operon